jgi:uncharacterized protein (DUF58 family)
MRLTARGWTAVGLVALAVVLAWAFGERSLNAVAAPTLAALVVAGLSVWRSDPPTVEYGVPRPGFPDDERSLRIDVDGDGLASVRYSPPPGLSARQIDATVALPRTFERTVTLAARGVHDLGAPVVGQRDPLGLVERRTEAEAGGTLLVYPRVYALADATLGGLFSDRATAERQEFDRLREYVPGDPLKNVHWKSSAKRDDFLVMEFAPTDRTESITVAATAEEGCADAMADATATVALAALDAGLSVELVVPEGHLPPGKGETHREDLLRLLAETGHGTVEPADAENADVLVESGPESTLVSLPGAQRAFESLVTGRPGRTATEVAA